MDEPQVFSVFFPCEESTRVKEWLKGYVSTAGYAYGKLQRVGPLEFSGPVFVVQFLNKVDEEAMREHFYP
jgi:hypothetical protein